ncbi:uncharacterized protein LOC132935032 [Metopolophium dirhodum]|uniref:uncharacterized protein LOC132935032 n=1 Tax=Metopolophium dirhodum TaxID=44670 RepID=UPI00298FC5E3|nr:uncharacterized protein LOC132935032 [Metopolophium dirhodum]
MSKDSYLQLVQLISPAIHKKNTNMRECVNAEERILITLRYLGTGGTFSSLAVYFARGESTVGGIVSDTSKVIWEVLKDKYMQVPNREQWTAIAQRFETLWNLPNCIGAIDGKHVRIEKFANSGSSNFNYKSYHSTVLLACCDADGLFTMIETGYAGRNSDGGIFRASAMKYWIHRGELDIPTPSLLTYDENYSSFPYYFVADEACPLSRYLMRPYPQRVLDNVKRIYNYRISRARKTIECTFGMVCEKFAVLNGPIRIRESENVNFVIKAACVLHNYVRKLEGLPYVSTYPQDCEPKDQIDVRTTAQNMTINETSSPAALRNYLANYFLTPRGSVPWQWKYAIN